MPLYGLQTDWVYPALAFVPIWIPSLFPNYELAWLVMIFLLNTSVAVALNHRGPDGSSPGRAGWLFLVALVALGPIAISRIDSVSLVLALFGLLAIGASRLNIATALLTVAGWVKIWPIAVFLAMLASFRSRLWPLSLATAISAAILITGFNLGGASVLSFVTAQQERGLQIESVMATLWMWLSSFGLAEIYFDDEILTNQVRGPGVNELAASANALLFLALGAVFVLALYAKQKRNQSLPVFVWASLAGVASLIVFNKVGSPQFMLWLVFPILAGLYFGIPRFRLVAIIGLVIGVLTQLVYPIFYLELLALESGTLVLLTARNLLVIWLLVVAVLRLTREQALE
jgi:hypothetical protein